MNAAQAGDDLATERLLLSKLDRPLEVADVDRSTFGHPFAATGARIAANLAKLLSEKGGRGLISICTAGGMGVAAIMESAKG